MFDIFSKRNFLNLPKLKEIKCIKHFGQYSAQETVIGSLLLMEAYNEFAVIILLDLVNDTVREVGCQTHLREQRDIDRGGNLCCEVKDLCPFATQLLILIKHDRDSRQRYLAVLLAYEQRKVHKFVNSRGVGKLTNFTKIGTRKLIGSQPPTGRC